MDFYSGVALCLLLVALIVVGWGLFSPTKSLPRWTHRHDKLWHLIAFAGIAFLIQGVRPKMALWLIWVTLSLIGLLTEALQERYASGRRFSWGDVAANIMGASLGLIIASPVWTIARQSI